MHYCYYMSVQSILFTHLRIKPLIYLTTLLFVSVTIFNTLSDWLQSIESALKAKGSTMQLLLKNKNLIL